MKIKQLKLLAKESALTSEATRHYILFMKKRFPKETDENYAGEWAERFAHGRDWVFGDYKSREILIKIGRRTSEGKLK